MGFKIESLTNMQNIATTVSDLSTEVNSTNQKVISSIDSLQSGISGGGIETTLPKLSSAISTHGTDVSKLLSDIATFINSQVSAYTANEQTVTSDLDSINSALDGMEV